MVRPPIINGDIAKREGISPFLYYIDKRVKKQNKNFLGVFLGSPGTGKSYGALYCCQILDPDFNIDRVCFTVQEFLNLMNLNLKPGSCILMDEAGIAANSRQWYSLSNRLLNYIMQSFRWKRYIVFMALPDVSFLDSAARKLLHMYIELQKIDPVKKISIAKPIWLDHNQRKGKIYYHYPKIILNNKFGTYKRVAFPLASEKLLYQYEEKKKRFTDDLYRDMEEDLIQKKVEKKAQTSKVFSRPLTDRQKMVLECWKDGIFRNKDIAEKTEIPASAVSSSIKYMRKRGYFKEDYQKDGSQFNK